MHEDRTRRKPVLGRTIEFIRGHIASRALGPGDIIPPARRFAVMADVSFVTMCRALRELRAGGVLVLINKRTYAISGRKTTLPIAPAQPRVSVIRKAVIRPWQKTAQAISEDIRNGVFHSGAMLPSTKILEGRYRISYRTLGKALMHLENQRSLERTANGGFSVPALRGEGWRQRIVCVTPSMDMQSMAFGLHDEALLRALEFHCEQARIKINTLLLYYDPKYDRDRYRFRGVEAEMDCRDLSGIGRDPVLGFVFFIPWELGVAYQRAISSLLENRKPMVIVDETSQLALPDSVMRSGLARIITTGASRQSGRIVSRHLLSLGHRKVAFISADHHYLWSTRRLEGLSEAFAEAGFPGGVSAFISGAISDNSDRRQVSQEHAVFEKRYRRWRDNVPPALAPEFGPALAQDAGRRAEWQMRVRAHVDAAAADSHITALVAINDTTAAQVVARLREKGVRVPADISVVSFDDTIEALRCGVSSYNFNAPARAASIVGFMLGRKPYCEAMPEIAGFIVDRGTIRSIIP